MYTRQVLKNNILKSIIIRVDYEGVTDINIWIDKFKKSPLSTKFLNYRQGQENNVTLDLSNAQSIAQSRSIPLSDFTAAYYHIFTKSQFSNHNDDVQLSIGRLFTVMQITCRDYTLIDEYIDYLNSYLEALIKQDKFIKIVRVGIRKISGKIYNSFEEVECDFNSSIMIPRINTNIKDFIESKYEDHYYDRSNKIKINYNRYIKGILRKVDDQTMDSVQVVLDLDGYVDNDVINDFKIDTRKNFKESILIPINDRLFDLFKEAVTEFFLSRCANEK